MYESSPNSGEHQGRLQAADRIGMQAVSIVRELYGDAYPNAGHPPHVSRLPYHNVSHTLSVRNHAMEAAREVGLSPYNTALAVVAASAHDIDHFSPRGLMEWRSAEWAASEMAKQGFTSHDIGTVALAILGTVPTFDNLGMSGQKVTEQRYHSGQAEQIARLVACADMADLYSAKGPMLGIQLFLETQPVVGPGQKLLDPYMDFHRKQLSLTERYRYPHPAGESLFGGLRSEVNSHHAMVLEGLESGRINSWQQLVGMQLGFHALHAR